MITLQRYIELLEAIGKASNVDELVAVRRQVLAVAEDDPRREGLGEALASRAMQLGVLHQLPEP